MGMIFHRTLKCENCGYEYQGRGGGHVISNGEHYGISQYYCNNCHVIIDLEYYSSLKENIEKYTYPDGTEISCNINKTKYEQNVEETLSKPSNAPKDVQTPLCQKCGNHLIKLNIDSNESALCPECGQKSLKQEEIHIVAYID